MYQFLPHVERMQLVEQFPAELPQVVLVLDNAAFDRLGSAYTAALSARGIGPLAEHKAPGTVLVNIDHHLGNTMYGDYNLVDPACCACGELLYYAFKELELPLTLDVAINLYATILTDTGRFSYANTNYNTLSIASELIQLGVDPYDVVNRIYNKRSPQQIKLLAEVLGTIKSHPGTGYFTCTVTQAMLAGTDCDLSDTEGAVDIMKTVGNYDCCFLLKEEQDGKVKVSARAITDFDVRSFARRFGGGGHPAASGFRIESSITEAPQVLHAAMLQHRAELAAAHSH
jgi:phosphoesterase RecJ-like protein